MAPCMSLVKLWPIEIYMYEHMCIDYVDVHAPNGSLYTTQHVYICSGVFVAFALSEKKWLMTILVRTYVHVPILM